MRKKTADKLLKKVVEDYDSIAESFDKTRQNSWSIFDLILPYIKDNDFVIDLGCGNGRVFGFLSTKKKIKYLGVEKSKNLLKKANENFKAQFIEGDMLKVPVENNLADVVIQSASLHHIPSRKLRNQAILEAKRILKNNGIFIISVWNLFQPKYKKYIYKAYLRSFLSLGKYDLRDTFIPWNNTVKRYYYAFKPKELKSMLEKNGFQILLENIGDNILFICKKTQ